MPTDSAAPLRLFPRPEVLAGFFRMDPRGRVRVPALAQLLGAPDSRVREVLLGEGVELRFDSLGWGEAAGYLFDAWPRARIIAALGPDARRIPAAFHPARVRWRIPRFILRAMQHQAALLRENDPLFVSPAVEDYIADILFTEIEPSTVAHLATDRAFFAAYHYPP